MHRSFYLGLPGLVFVLCAAACGGDKDPEPCPALPPCIAGSTYNATSCACVLDDEVPYAAEGGPRGDAMKLDDELGAKPTSDSAVEASDAAVEATD